MSLYLPDLELEVPVIGIAGSKGVGKTYLLSSISKRVPGMDLPFEGSPGYLTDSHVYFVDFDKGTKGRRNVDSWIWVVSGLSFDFGHVKKIKATKKPIHIAVTRLDFYGPMMRLDYEARRIFRELLQSISYVSNITGEGIFTNEVYEREGLVEKITSHSETLGLPRARMP